MIPWTLSRVSIRKTVATRALVGLLLPEGPDKPVAPATGHRLIWSLFADAPDRSRDFLWRALDPGRFLVLSHRPPCDPHGLFDIDTKPFDVRFRAGQRLDFSLRANPTVARRREGRRSQRCDVVMNALHALPPDEDRRTARPRLEREQGVAWLEARAAACGFALARHDDTPLVRVTGYRPHRLARSGAEPLRFSSLDLDGTLTVIDPERLYASIQRGIGSGKAFGCGLLLVRPALS
ncbi:type I-E CRISPR-associated protein Cas6/Cse3/CasE [Pararhodospirillum photometricum]|uniref:CRISPR-associated protein, CT1974 n=1 Tax=Pararhodospirillum photometricum DSM 122 TaxID=1150469 RepID=H6SKX2_PARPM|nr:type I-E CRISPR-associated protein Cas6/Cse3/CasE [Pararhodospirillum photometricum]CCG08637.1 CRISPR-associated protein, CT1974 [Pararhodospirillum photometricum DSM 122]